jgi:hypothetical protein
MKSPQVPNIHSHMRNALLEQQAFQIRLKLIESDTVAPQELRDAAMYLRPKEYQDVVLERSWGRRCGYPLCQGVLTTAVTKQHYKISLSQRKVFDIRELHAFCSTECATASRYYQEQLSEIPLSTKTQHNIPKLWDEQRR